MNVKRQITPTITVGDQPTEEDLKSLRREGCAAIVNVRNDGEPDQPLSTAAEGEQVRALGMDYLHVGVGGAPLTADKVSALCAFLDKHATNQVLVHCRKGGRAVGMVVLRQALKERWAPADVGAKSLAMGLQLEDGLRTMIENYLSAPQA